MSIPAAKDNVQDTVEDGPTRYAAFAMRLRTLITASSRCEFGMGEVPDSITIST